MIFVQFAPHIVQTTLSVASLWVVFFYGLKLLDKEASLAAACIWASCVILFAPWIDKMYIFDFQVAYLWGTAFTILFCYVLLKTRKNVILIVLGIILGCWQECFGFPIFISIIILWIFCPKHRNLRTLVSELTIFIGLVWLYISPGGQEYRSHGHPMYSRIILLIPFAIPSFLALAWFLIRVFRRKCYSAITVILVSSSFTSALLMIYAGFGPRVGWWAVIAGFLSIFNIGYNSSVFRKIIPIIKHVIAASLLVFTSIHLVFVAYYSYLQGEEYYKILQRFLSNPQKTVFAKMYLREQIPLICFQKPFFGIFSHERVANDITQFYAPGKDKLKVVPEELEFFKSKDAEIVTGSANMFRYKGYLVGPVISPERTIINVTIWYGDYKTKREMYHVPFIDYDGIYRAWYMPRSLSISDLRERIPTKADF